MYLSLIIPFLSLFLTEDRRHHRRPPKIRRIRGTPPSKTIPRGLPLHPCTTRAPCAMHVRVPCHTRTNPPPLSPYRTQEDNARRHPMGRRCTVSQSHSTIHPMQRHLDRRIEKITTVKRAVILQHSVVVCMVRSSSGRWDAQITNIREFSLTPSLPQSSFLFKLRMRSDTRLTPKFILNSSSMVRGTHSDRGPVRPATCSAVKPRTFW